MKKNYASRFRILLRGTVMLAFWVFIWIPPLYATEVEEISSPYGFKAWMVQDHSLPIISLHFAFMHGGAGYDPKGKEGLAYITAAMLTEGAGDLDSPAFKKRLEEKGIKLSVDVDSDTFYITVKTLSEHLGEVSSLLQQVLLSPRLEQTDLDRVKKQTLTAIAANKENPEWVAENAFEQKVFANHPYAHSILGTEQSVAAITQDDIKNFIAMHLTRAVLHIAAVGDIRPQQLTSMLDSNFVELPLTKSSGDAVKEFADFPAGSETVIDMDVPQSTAVFGFKGVKREDKDFYAAYILNYILGSGNFDSRLMKRVREEKGLAYSIYTTLDTMEYAGLMEGMVASQNDNIYESLALTKKEMDRVRNEGVTEAELKAAKQYIIGSFPLMLDKNEKLASFLLSMDILDLGKDYLDKRNGYIESVTLADVHRVAKRLLTPEKLVTVIVGKKEAMKKDIQGRKE